MQAPGVVEAAPTLRRDRGTERGVPMFQRDQHWEVDMADKLKKGDKVAWETSQGETQGVVEKKQTNPTRIKDHKVAASEEEPQYIVKSDKTGKKAAHKAEALQKRDAI